MFLLFDSIHIQSDENEKIDYRLTARANQLPSASSVILGEKKNGDICFCVDCRKVNHMAKFDTFPCPELKMIWKE